MSTRSTKNGPFCWQNKAALRTVADACDGRADFALVIAVYVALTWISSDEQSESFTFPKNKIAERAGVSYRKAADVLAFLERLGLIAITKNVVPGTRESGPNTYTLGTACATSGTQCLRLGTEAQQGSVPRLEKNVLEESLELAAPTAPGGDEAKGTRTPRARNVLIDALVSIDGSSPVEVTKSAWGAARKALADIKFVCPKVTPAEIARRAANYHSQFPDAAISPSALSKHWARCQHAPTATNKGRPEAAVHRIDLNAP
jgi:hypothetical protein